MPTPRTTSSAPGAARRWRRWAAGCRGPATSRRCCRSTRSSPSELAEAVEGWAYRASQDRGEILDRRTAARARFAEEFAPVTRMRRDAQLVDAGETDADAYVRLGGVRYRLMRTMDWNEEIIEKLRRER